MNYSKQSARRRQKKVASKSTMQRKRIGIRIFTSILVCIILFGIIGLVSGGLFIKKIINDSPEVSVDDIRPEGFTSVIYAKDGTTVTEKLTMAGANRTYKPLDEIPLDLQHAFVAIEDTRFYTHNGIDPQGIARAFIKGITSGSFSEGASTITQQLIKNNVFPNFVNEQTFMDRLERKIQEQYLALKLEKQVSKDEIMEAYLNTINLGQNTLGVQSAAQRYFGKNVNDLTLSESATIAAITKNPSGYNPISHPEENNQRRTKVLDDMLEQGYIDQAQHDEALADNVYERIQSVNSYYVDTTTTTSYFNDALTQQLMKDLTASDGLGYSETQAYNLIYGGGLSIYSTQDLAIQEICDEELKDDSNFPRNIEWGVDYALTITRADGTQENYSSGHLKLYGWNTYGDDQGRLFSSIDEAYSRIGEFRWSLSREDDISYDEYINFSPQPQCSVCIIDQGSGEIRALTGGRGDKTTNRSLNRAYTGDPRQAGSTFKPLAVYSPALDNGATLATTEVDEPYTYRTGQQVHNWWGNSYRGTSTYRDGIVDSMNIIAVKVLDKVGIDTGYDYVTNNFGITTLDSSDRVQSLALGGITHGVYNYQLTAAYAAIANNGVYNDPILYTKVIDHDGNVLIDNTGRHHQAIKDTTAALLTDAMIDVIKVGTAPDCELTNMIAAGKSGTTSDNKDLWFEGYTPYLTCGIWLGYDDRKEMLDSQWNYHEKIWANIMNRIDYIYGWSASEFASSALVQKASICKQTGLLAVSSCNAVTEVFAKDTIPTEYCGGHKTAEDIKKEEEEKKKAEEEKKKAEEQKNNPSGSGESGSGGSGSGESGSGGESGGESGSEKSE